MQKKYQMFRKTILFVWLLGVPLSSLVAQEVEDFSRMPVADYYNPVEYEIAGINVTGVQYLDESILIQLSGLTVGQKVMVPVRP